MHINTKTPDLCSDIFSLAYVPTTEEIEQELIHVEKIRKARMVMALAITLLILTLGSYYLVPNMALNLSTIVTYCIASTFIYRRISGRRMDELEADVASLTFISSDDDHPVAENTVTANSVFYAAALHEKTRDYVAKVKEQQRVYTYGELWMFQRILGGKFSL